MKNKLLALYFILGIATPLSAQNNTFPNSENVGIGIINPSEKLEVDGTIKS